MSSLPKKIFAVVVTYNPGKWLDKCFSSLAKSEISLRIIAIDNGSTDGSQDILRSKYPEVELMQSSSNLGFGKANNIGIKKAYEAGADFVFLLNQDAWIETNTIKTLVSIHSECPEFGICSPIHLNGSGSALDTGFSNYIIPSFCPGLFSDVFLKKGKSSIYETSFVNAAAWLVSRKCIEIVGGFNPIFFQYGEDDNYIHRLRYHGLKVGVLLNCFIYHDREEKENLNLSKTTLEIKTKMHYSNPLICNSIKNDIKKYRFFLFKRKLLFDKRSANYYKTMLEIIDRNKAELENYLDISKSTGQSFL